MARNIVICCDGTGQSIPAAESNAAHGTAPRVNRGRSNVFRLFDLLVKNSRHQVSFYDPGIGMIPMLEREQRWLRVLRNLRDEWLGLGLMENVQDAYVYLMETYRPGDRVFLFGFSRGAFTVRALAGLIRCVGLLRYEHLNLLSHARDVFENMDRRHRASGRVDQESADELAAVFRRFSRPDTVRIAFLGVWDTVKAYGYLTPRALPFIRNNELVDVVRHAVSIDEHRTPFQVTGWSDRVVRSKHLRQDVLEVWFAGDHSDIGGGHQDEDLLAKTAFDWMLGEATHHHLLAELTRYEEATGWSRGASVGHDARPHDLSHSPLETAAWMLPRTELINTQFPPIREWHCLERGRGTRNPLAHTFPDEQWLKAQRAIGQAVEMTPSVHVHASVLDRWRTGAYLAQNLERLFRAQSEQTVAVHVATTQPALEAAEVLAQRERRETEAGAGSAVM